ncbi:MAG: Chromosome partition protein smc, partial [Parcubacteria group bacterium Gr01-1014_72]
MYLKSLELTGFKSFAKKTALFFNTHITAVVGPNGSGKSNVAEAFQFVLGEQSIKSLRGKKTEDLIWNGGADAPRANRAAVRLVFDNASHVFPIDFTEVALERIIHRDAVSEYLVNGSQVRLKDILELLGAAHIGVSGHHIISQGEADRILSANRKERRAIVEDALGLKVFQYKKEEAKRKLEKTEENITAVGMLCKELAPHVKFLKKQVEKVERAFQMKDELKHLYLEYFRREELYMKHAREALREERHLPETRLASLELELSAVKTILSSSAGQSRESRELLSIEERMREAAVRRQRLERSIGRIEGEIAGLQKLASRTGAAEGGAPVPFRVFRETVESVLEECAGATETSDTKTLRGIIERIREVIQALFERHRARGADERSTLPDEKELLAEKVKLEEELPALSKEEQELTASLARFRKVLEETQQKEREAERKMFTLVSEKNQCATELRDALAQEAA